MENHLENLSVDEKEKELQQEDSEKYSKRVHDEIASIVENSIDVQNLVKELDSLRTERDKLVKQIEKLKIKLSPKKKFIKKVVNKTTKKAIKKKVTKLTKKKAVKKVKVNKSKGS